MLVVLLAWNTLPVNTDMASPSLPDGFAQKSLSEPYLPFILHS